MYIAQKAIYGQFISTPPLINSLSPCPAQFMAGYEERGGLFSPKVSVSLSGVTGVFKLLGKNKSLSCLSGHAEPCSFLYRKVHNFSQMDTIVNSMWIKNVLKLTAMCKQSTQPVCGVGNSSWIVSCSRVLCIDISWLIALVIYTCSYSMAHLPYLPFKLLTEPEKRLVYW